MKNQYEHHADTCGGEYPVLNVAVSKILPLAQLAGIISQFQRERLSFGVVKTGPGFRIWRAMLPDEDFYDGKNITGKGCIALHESPNPACFTMLFIDGVEKTVTSDKCQVTSDKAA